MDSKIEQAQLNDNARSEVDILEVMEMIPHRQPFLMIDRVEDIVVRERDRYQECHDQRTVFPGSFPGAAGHAGSADR